VKSVSVSLPQEVIDAITTEAEVQEFGSRSEYLRYIIERRSEIDSIDKTEVDVVEAVAERLKQSHHEEISELEEQVRGFSHHIREIEEDAEYARGFHDQVEKQGREIDEVEDIATENQEELEELSRALRENQRELRDKDKEIAHLKSQLRSLKSEVRELSS